MKGETVFSLNQKYLKKVKITENQLKQQITEILGIEYDRKLTAGVYTGKIPMEGYEVKKYFLENNKKDFALPVYIIQKPNATTQKTVIWLPENGKEKVLEDPIVANLIAQNQTIIVADFSISFYLQNYVT